MEDFKSIYIVEDDLLFGELMMNELCVQTEAEITTFYTGKECIENLYKMPDLVLLDYDLGEEKGIDVLKKIRSFDPDIPVVFVSGQKSGELAADCLKYGAFDYITKENFDDLRFQLNMILNKILSLKQIIKTEFQNNLIKKRTITFVCAVIIISILILGLSN
tara:strand:- start:2136 stop:2621 length:486 start_codon:yes stop_codon:yes gene_type:complete